RLAGLELDPLEPEKPHAPVACGFREIELRDVGALALPGIRDRESRSDRVSAFELEIAVIEARIAEAVTEGEHWLCTGLCEPAVTDLRNFVVIDRDCATPRCTQTGQIGSRRLSEALGERDRQATRRIDLTCEHFGDGASARLARIPRFDDRPHLL